MEVCTVPPAPSPKPSEPQKCLAYFPARTRRFSSSSAIGITVAYAKTTKNSFVFLTPQGFDVTSRDCIEEPNRARERIIRTETLGTNNQGLQGPRKAGMRKSFGQQVSHVIC